MRMWSNGYSLRHLSCGPANTPSCHSYGKPPGPRQAVAIRRCASAGLEPSSRAGAPARADASGGQKSNSGQRPVGSLDRSARGSSAPSRARSHRRPGRIAGAHASAPARRRSARGSRGTGVPGPPPPSVVRRRPGAHARAAWCRARSSWRAHFSAARSSAQPSDSRPAAPSACDTPRASCRTGS